MMLVFETAINFCKSVSCNSNLTAIASQNRIPT
jgi:hypothetical protein